MVTVHRQYGLRFSILTEDHEPPHVHIIGDGRAKVNIIGSDGLPELVSSIGFKVSDRRRAMEVVRERQAEFLAEWRRIHGDK